MFFVGPGAQLHVQLDSTGYTFRPMEKCLAEMSTEEATEQSNPQKSTSVEWSRHHARGAGAEGSGASPSKES